MLSFSLECPNEVFDLVNLHQRGDNYGSTEILFCLFGRTCRSSSFALFPSIQALLTIKPIINVSRIPFLETLKCQFFSLLRITNSTGPGFLCFCSSLFLLTFHCCKAMDKRRRKQAKTSSCYSEGELSFPSFFPVIFCTKSSHSGSFSVCFNSQWVCFSFYGFHSLPFPAACFNLGSPVFHLFFQRIRVSPFSSFFFFFFCLLFPSFTIFVSGLLLLTLAVKYLTVLSFSFWQR
jgi:hypothetical protein